MNNISEKYFKTLELSEILLMLADEACLESTKKFALSLKPDFNQKRVTDSLKETEAAFLLMGKFSAPSFGSISGLEDALKKADVGATLSVRELINVCESLRIIRSAKSWREECDNKAQTDIDYLFSALYPNKYLEDKINSVIKSEDEIYDSASDALYDIRRKISAKTTKIRDILDKTVRGPLSKYLQESVITQRDGRYVVPVRLEYKSQVAGIVHDTSASGQTLFIEPMSVVEANNDIRVLKIKEEEEIARILSELSASVSEFSDSIRLSFKSLCRLDLVFAKAKLAYKMNAQVPKINTEGRVNLVEARHPLINPKTVVAININLGFDFDTLVITGPNTGGKTVALKTLGLLTLMTLCGLMIPAKENSEIAIFTKIFADIGDEQSIEQSLSTFSSHMVNIISILDNCDGNSLVLLDELCAGTDPVEGAALARAILMHLSKRGVKSVVTTHYPELKTYALDTERVRNASCEFDVKTLKPTYRLIIGTPGRSNAFAISEKLGLSKDIINLADLQVSEEERRFERIVSELESERQSAEREKREAEEIKAHLKKRKDASDKAEEELSLEREKVMQQTRQKASDIIESTRYKAGELLNQLEEMKKTLTADNAADILSKAKALYKGTVSKLEEDSDPIENADTGEKLKAPPKENDVVMLADIGKEATVIKTDIKAKRAFVLAGSFKMWVPFDNMRIKKHSAPTKKTKISHTASGVISRKDRIVKSELDIRGFASDEAIIELDRFIDTAILSGITTVTVIHGKGTGVLRKAVQDHLRHHKAVKSFRVGTFGEGENGVTVAELK